MSSSLAGNTKIKTSQVYIQSFTLFKDKKTYFFIGHKNGVHLYDLDSNKIQQVKLDKSLYSGPFSCFTTSDELIFFCCGSKVLAMGQNLKIVFELDTFLAVDKIDNIHVHGYRLFLVAENMLNEFLFGGVQLMNKKSRLTQPTVQKSQDVQEQVFDAKINHSLLINILGEKPFLLLLKSNNLIETFQKKQPEAIFKTNSPPTYAYLYPQNSQNQNQILVGTASGQIIYLEVNRKSIKQLWSISESKGRINTICELKNGFFIAKDKTIEFWNKNKQLIKEQTIQQKVIVSTYLSEQQLLIYGTLNGNIVEIKNYEKMIKENKKVNEQKHREQVLKEIQLLRHQKALLLQKLAEKKGKHNNNQMSSLKKINVKSSINIDYVSLCYNIELQSDCKICKIVVQGPVTLLEEKENIFFSSSINNNRQNVYILRYENEKNLQIKVKYPQSFNELQKVNILVYFSFESRVHNIMLDIKQLSLHQKISVNSFNQNNPNLNRLQMRGNFKFQMKRWLVSLFNDFNTQQMDEYQVVCYESIITKHKILVKFKPGYCIVYGQSSIALLIIKKKIMQKSKQMNLNISFQTLTNKQSVHEFLSNIQKKISQIIEVKRKHELLPGLLQLKNELDLQMNEQLLLILDSREMITCQYRENVRLESEIKEKIVDLYRSYRLLNNHEVNQFEEKSIVSGIQRCDMGLIQNIVCL